MAPRLRAGRGTNIAVLATLVAAFCSGVVAFALGGPWSRWVVLAHGAVGFGLVVLAPWKGSISARGVRRRGPRSTPSLVLAALIAAVVVSGVAHALGARSLGAVSTMQVHVGAAISSVPLAAWHLFARPVRPRAADLSRRSILRGAGVLGAGAALYVATEGVSRLAGLPGADRRFTGSHEVGSFDPTAMPATMWLNDRVPSRPDSVVEIDGRRWSVSELDVGDAMRVTLDCTGGWWSVHDWSGVLLDRVLASPHRAGRSVLVRSVTGYQRRLPLGDAPRLLLATRIDGEPVPAVHGGPVRLVAPGRRGFWWVKWIERVATQDTPWWWQPPFPLA